MMLAEIERAGRGANLFLKVNCFDEDALPTDDDLLLLWSHTGVWMSESK